MWSLRGCCPRSVGRRHGPFAHVVQLATCGACSGHWEAVSLSVAFLQFPVALLKSTAADMFRLKSIARGAFLLRLCAFRSEKHSRARGDGSGIEFAVQWSLVSQPRASRSLPDLRQQSPHASALTARGAQSVRLSLARLFVRQGHEVVSVAVSRPIHTHVF